MSDTLFVQFVVKTFLSSKTSPLDHDDYVYGLVNGFSDTYDLCKQHGDFYWVDLDLNNRIKSAAATRKHCDQIGFPIDEGRAFVSCSYPGQLYQVYSWAKRYPNVSFIAGGNVVDVNKLAWNPDDIPKNMVVTAKSVEAYFGLPDWHHSWWIDPPKDLMNQKDHPVFFTYNLNNTCYWGKCNFCHYFDTNERVRPFYNLEFSQLPETDIFKMVCLYSPSISPKEISEVLPQLPDREDFFYRMYVRGSKDESDALMKAFQGRLNPELFEPFIGVEFPSKRMNDIINKGVDVKTMIKSINRLDRIGAKVSVGLILGLPDLIEADLDDLESFLTQLENNGNVSIKINKLFARWGTPAHDQYKEKSLWKLGPFYQGFNPVLTDSELDVNDRAYEMIEKSGITLMSNYKLIREVEKDPTQKHRLFSGIVGTEK